VSAPPAARLFSVGHSNLAVEGLAALLRGAAVEAVADVRSSPFSRRLPQFNRPALERFLQINGIAYVFLGDWLGGRPTDDALYDDEGRVDYERVRRTEGFQRGLDRLLGAGFGVAAMLCAEEDPLDCHRGLMIAPALAERGAAPLHLRKGGAVETNADMERRLLAATRLDRELKPDLFTPPPTDDEVRRVVAEAYRRMARKKAFRRGNPG
jgi:uncharacterized protein (DUF488 family)